MAYTYHIEKEQNVLGTTRTIYFTGDNRWTTEFANRKKYTNKSVATSEIYGFGGSVITE